MFFIIDTEARRGAAIAYLRKIPADKSMCVSIDEYVRQRTSAQNRLWHKWLTIIAKDQGCEKEELETEVKRNVLGYVERKDREGRTFMEVKGTSGLNVKQMAHVLRAVEQLAMNLNIHLPRHDDYSYAMMYEEEKAKGNIK